MIRTAFYSDAGTRFRPTGTLLQFLYWKAMFATVPQLGSWVLKPVSTFLENLMTVCTVVRSIIESIMVSQ